MASMFCTIPFTKLLNKGKAPQLCIASIILNSVGVGMVGLFVRPDNVNVNSVFNPILLLGIFILGLGYVLFLQSITVWGKQLYPEDSRGQFEGIRILFFVLIPMIVAPLISNPIIKNNGQVTDANGFVSYLPTGTLFIVGAGLVLLAFIPLIFAIIEHNKVKKIEVNNNKEVDKVE